MLLIRSLLFWLVFALSMVVIAPLVVLSYPMPYARRYRLASTWARLNLRWLKLVCRLDYRLEGREHIPDQPSIIFCKHQSTWETLALQEIFPPQVWVMKRELLRIPFFGWGIATLKPIAIDRKAGRRAIQQLVSQGIERLREGLWVTVFPEGTRVAPGQRGRYKLGGAILAEKSGALVVPVAHNAGEFWPRHGFIKRPGTIRVVIGPPIVSEGQSAAEILRQAEDWIEGTMERITDPALLQPPD
ncbi:lysophospholipid acyltransferase family protein [Thiohalobacter sp. IOR34]|uniref:lysophospholipid acyltransferase family protein n=1 Tax=Thiohalobacter sp. IOR34 TaxID=3057176 RepID=UPI0025B017FA|nr:lysophospholipid acyltransferase family protein [Thiohalobacter sp. IOR34]WJW75512.1 lysophospholipid acyltransferase family protein [Thiohalobacter sp. IOR34]